MIENRLEVINFAQSMEVTLRDNDYKDPWKKESMSYLLACLEHEVKELKKAILDRDNIYDEAVDVANFAMFIADNSTRLK